MFQILLCQGMMRALISDACVVTLPGLLMCQAVINVSLYGIRTWYIYNYVALKNSDNRDTFTEQLIFTDYYPSHGRKNFVFFVMCGNSPR